MSGFCKSGHIRNYAYKPWLQCHQHKQFIAISLSCYHHEKFGMNCTQLTTNTTGIYQLTAKFSWH